MLKVTIYSKPDCHLCDEAKMDLQRLQDEFRFDLTERNILDDPADFERFQYLIPVIDIHNDIHNSDTDTIQNGLLLYPPLDYWILRQALLKAHSTHA